MASSAIQDDRPAQASGSAPVGRNVFVFVHGIFSSCDTFECMRQRLEASQDLQARNPEYWRYDYDFHDALEENGRSFASFLKNHFCEADNVVIVCHSMGGLVARLAVLSERLPFVRLLFLLGTPNSGAIRLSQLGLLSKMLHTGVAKFSAVFPRKLGVSDLSRAAKIMERNVERAHNVAEICYASVPGMLFRADQSFSEDVCAWSSAGFAVLANTLELISSLKPLAAIHIQRPHDGIVEEASNNLITSPIGRWHEKKSSTTKQRGNIPATYAHLRLFACRKLNHIQIHANNDVIDVVARISIKVFELFQPPRAGGGIPREFKSCLEEWDKSRSLGERADIDPSFD